MSQHVVVVGGGLVGASAALGLAQLGLQVTLIERAEPERRMGRLGVDVRNVALSPASTEFLASLGVWQNDLGAAYSRMHVWEQWGNAELDFTAASVGAEQLGWIAEQSELLTHIWAQLKRHDALAVVLEEVEALDGGTDAVEVALSSGRVVAADLVIAADGGRSKVRERAGYRVDEKPVGQAALATVVRVDGCHADTAWQRFLTDGPLALLPSRRADICSVVWSQPDALAAARKVLPADEFCAMLTRFTEARLGTVVEIDERMVFPLTQQLANQTTFDRDKRVLLIGDALRVIHPLAGMGVNLGFEDVNALLHVIEAARSGTTDGVEGISRPELWRRFLRQRRVRSQMVIQGMAFLKSIYGQSHPGAALARNVGVGLIQRVDLLKQQVVREAMGLGPLANF